MGQRPSLPEAKTLKEVTAPEYKQERMVNAEKLDTALRLILNGNETVNAWRSMGCGAVTSQAKVEPEPSVMEQYPPQDELAQLDIVSQMPVGGTLEMQQFSPKKIKEERPSLHKPAEGVKVNVFLSSRGIQKLKSAKVSRNSLHIASLSLEEVSKLRYDPNVYAVVMGDTLTPPDPEVGDLATNATARKIEHTVDTKGKVLIGIIDVGGFDFSHPDFANDDGTTRWVSIWDQGGNSHPSPGDNRFNFGSELTADSMNEAILEAPQAGVPATRLCSQSQMSPGSHATHVASIAGGNTGVCPGAVLAGVLIDIPRQDLHRRKSFYDSTRLVLAVEYLVDLADRLKLPLSINVSLGTNGHAHDGSAAVCRWIDALLTEQGRSLTVAAGNAGQSIAQHDNDLSYVMGRVHAAGTIQMSGLTQDIAVNVIGNGRLDVSENKVQIWYSAQDRMSVMVRTPSGKWYGPIEPRKFLENEPMPSGSMLSVYNDIYERSNGCNYISVFLSPGWMQAVQASGIESGEWIIRLVGQEIRDGRWDAWIERDDPRRKGRVGPRELWNFPAFFGDNSFDGLKSVSTLATGFNVISVGNMEEAVEKMNISSSWGPTRDMRQKPDIAAPGTKIIAANGFDDRGFIEMTGTSMAAPYVCGVAATMLASQPKLTGPQILGVIYHTAKPMPGFDYRWKEQAGFGVIYPARCIAEAQTFPKYWEVEP